MPGTHWTETEKRSLRRQLEASNDIDVVEISDRSRYAIRGQAKRMGLIDIGEPRAKWPLRQRKLLRKLKADGYSPREIHAFDLLGSPARSFWSIRKKWGRMKLADPRRSRLMKKKKIWRDDEKEKFDSFLREHAKDMTPEQIGREWGVSRGTVSRRMIELGVKATRDEVMLMDYSLAKQRRAKRRLRKLSLQSWVTRREQYQQRLADLASTLRSAPRPPEEKQCEECGQSWPKRREFFHLAEKRISIGKSRYFKRRCRLCENTRRRATEQRRKVRVAGRNGVSVRHGAGTSADVSRNAGAGSIAEAKPSV